MRNLNATDQRELRHGEAGRFRNAPDAPHVNALRRQPKMDREIFRAKRVDKRAIRVPMSSHAQDIHATLIGGKHELPLEKHGRAALIALMRGLSERIRERIAELDLKQTEAARLSGVSAARFGNYAQGKRTPDLETIVRIAKALRTSTDWLLGLNSAGPIELTPVVVRLLELEGLPSDRAHGIAAAVQEALRILTALPDEGDATMRSRLAAQAAWQSRHALKQD